MIKSVFSTKESIDGLVADLQHQLEGFPAAVIIFFASSHFAPAVLSEKMQAGFSSAVVFGCTTAGEISNHRMLKNSVVAMAFTKKVVSDLKLEIIQGIKDGGNVKPAIDALNAYFGPEAFHANFDQYVGLVLIDGLSFAEEKLMDQIGDYTNLLFIGGSAGDDLKFQRTHVFAAGKAYTDAALLAVLKIPGGYETIKTQSFRVLDKKLVATEVNAATREIIEFDHQPAASAYAHALGVPVAKVSQYFMTNPLGLVTDNEIFVRSPQQVKGDRLVLYCNLLQGMEVSILESTDIVRDTKKALDVKMTALGNITGLINFHCILRTLELEQKGQTKLYGDLFRNIPSIGFSTYGEQYVGHINQTSSILLFK